MEDIIRLKKFVDEFDSMCAWFELSSGLHLDSVSQRALDRVKDARKELEDLVPMSGPLFEGSPRSPLLDPDSLDPDTANGAGDFFGTDYP